jgi:hypothetical protein
VAFRELPLSASRGIKADNAVGGAKKEQNKASMAEEPEHGKRPRETEGVLGNGTARILNLLAILALASVLLALLALFLIFLNWYVAPTEAAERKGLVQAIGVLLVGLAGLVGLYFTWRNLNQTRQATQRTLELTEQGQITERFTRAIDQLGTSEEDGSKGLEIRLGGIYALERIAKDSKDDYGPIVEVLGAYVREHAPWPPKHAERRSREENIFISPAASQAPLTASSDQRWQSNSNEEEDLRPETDVQVILTVLGRIPLHYGNGQVIPLHVEPHADLQRTDLRGANLFEAHLEGANLFEAHLEKAFLRRAYLEKALLFEAHLEEAILEEAHLTGAVLDGAHLKGAILWEAHLEGAVLDGAYLEGANLSEAIGLIQEQIERAHGDRQTQLPEGLDRPAHWDKAPDDEQPKQDETTG